MESMRTHREGLMWAAGLFEGEGCFSLDRDRYAHAVINMTDEEPIRQFHEILGVGTVRGPRYHRDVHRKPYWTWTAFTLEDVQHVVASLWGGLGPRRRQRASAVLTTVHEYIGPRSEMKTALRARKGNHRRWHVDAGKPCTCHPADVDAFRIVAQWKA